MNFGKELIFFLILLLKLLANQPTPSPCPKFKPISMAHIHSWFYLKIFQIRSQLLSRRHTTTQVRHRRTSQLPPQQQSATTTEERCFIAAFTTKIGFCTVTLPSSLSRFHLWKPVGWLLHGTLFKHLPYFFFFSKKFWSGSDSDLCYLDFCISDPKNPKPETRNTTTRTDAYP